MVRQMALFENDRLIFVDEYPVLRIHAHGLGQDAAFDIAALAHQVIGAITMVAMDDILRDNWSFIQAIGDVMCGCPNQLDAALERTLVGIGADEGGQEAMMNIDDLVWIGIDEEWLQDLHIAREDQEVDFVLDESEDALLVCFARLLCDRKIVVGHVVHAGEWLQLLVIADDEGDIHRQFAAFPAPQQIDQAMIEFRDKYRRALALARVR